MPVGAYNDLIGRLHHKLLCKLGRPPRLNADVPHREREPRHIISKIDEGVGKMLECPPGFYAVEVGMDCVLRQAEPYATSS